MNTVNRVRELVLPLVTAADVHLYDVEHESGVLRIMLDKTGGIDVDTIGELTQQISDALDQDDPLPNSRYLLEVTSPGIERKLRTAEHFAAVTGERANVKLRQAVDGERRLEGVVGEAGESHFEFTVGEGEGATQRRIAYEEVEAARTIFNWSEELAAKKPKNENKPSKSSAGKTAKPIKKKKAS